MVSSHGARAEAAAQVISSVKETEALQKPDPLRNPFLRACPSFAGRRWCSSANDESQEAFSPLPAEIIKGVSCSVNRSQSSTAEILPVHLSSSPGKCLLKSSLGLRPPGQGRRIAEPTRDEEPRNPLLSMRCVVKGKEIEKKMRKAAACHDPPFLCERIVPLLSEKQAKGQKHDDREG